MIVKRYKIHVFNKTILNGGSGETTRNELIANIIDKHLKQIQAEM